MFFMSVHELLASLSFPSIDLPGLYFAPPSFVSPAGAICGSASKGNRVTFAVTIRWSLGDEALHQVALFHFPTRRHLGAGPTVSARSAFLDGTLDGVMSCKVLTSLVRPYNTIFVW